MSKFKVGDRVVSDRTPGTVLKLREREPGHHNSDYWVVVDEKSGLVSLFPESWITRYAGEVSSTHYTPDASGKDYLARCEETYSRDEMIGAYRFTIGKYVDRMGKKQGEPVEKELDKIIDYATRAKSWLGRQS